VTSFHLTDHACRLCGGRILLAEGGSAHRCADCGVAGDTLDAICCCGLPAIGPARLRCVRTAARVAGAPEVWISVSATEDCTP
jgi:hypothetical protein